MYADLKDLRFKGDWWHSSRTWNNFKVSIEPCLMWKLEKML